MMLKELNLKEVQELRNKDGELGEVASSFVDSMLKGECVMVKEKTTAKGRSYVFYRYDKKLYRYQIVGEIFL